MLLALVSWKGAPGVTTTALALGAAWPGEQPLIVAECDPAGGEILAGYGMGRVPPDRGILQLVLAARAQQTSLAQTLSSQLVALDERRTHWLLPGIGHPRQAEALPWDQVAELLAGLSDTDVIADCGRWSAHAVAAPVLRRADLTVLLVSARTSAVWAVRRAGQMLREDLGPTGRLAAVITGATAQTHPLSEIATFLEPVGIPVLGQLSHDPAAAAVLSDGAPAGRWFSGSRLLRDAAHLADLLIEEAGHRRTALSPPPELTERPHAAAGGAW